jgi:RNA polymerase sigma-70 factor (ECF subfamily)
VQGDEGGGLNRELVEAARRGDRDAFEALVRQEVAGVYRTALAILGNAADADEATQDAFLGAWRGFSSLREPARFDAWLGRIVVNACRMTLRRRRGVREITIEPDVPTAEIQRAQAGGADPAALAVDAMAFDRAFEGLSVDDRQLLTLAYAEDRPLEEVARLLGVPVGTVKSRLSRARSALSRALDRPAR